MLDKVLIGVLLILQAAHQPPAGAGNLGGIQRQVLGLGHLDGDRLELVQELRAAEGPSTDAQTAQHLGLVPHADLTQLNAGMDGTGQVLYQGAEVHPALGGEEEEYLVALKAVLGLYQLHLQTVLGDLLLADLEGLGLLLLVALPDLFVLLGGPAQHRAQRCGELHLIDGGVALGTFAVLHTPGGLDDHPFAGLEDLAVGVKIVLFASAFEADGNNFNHGCSPYRLYLSI